MFVGQTTKPPAQRQPSSSRASRGRQLAKKKGHSRRRGSRCRRCRQTTTQSRGTSRARPGSAACGSPAWACVVCGGVCGVWVGGRWCVRCVGRAARRASRATARPHTSTPAPPTHRRTRQHAHYLVALDLDKAGEEELHHEERVERDAARLVRHLAGVVPRRHVERAQLGHHLMIVVV